MRIVIASNAPHGTSAYAGQTRSLAPRLKALGHEVAILSTFGVHEAVIEHGGIRVYPVGLYAHGRDMTSAVCRDFRADLLLSLLDPHAWASVGQSAEWSEAAPWVPWSPIDHDPPRPDTVAALDWAWKVLPLTAWGEGALKDAGVREVLPFLPHGIETSVFKPLDQAECRRECGLPADAFIVGFVGVNKDIPSRKGLDKALAAFAEFKKRHGDAYLYLHTLYSAAMGGIDVPMLAEGLGLMRERDWVSVPPFKYITGQIGAGAMAKLYNSFDVLLAPSMGEGFGMPLLEAQACGVPVVTNKWTAMPENTVNGISVEPEGRHWTAGNSFWASARVGGLVDALEIVYDTPAMRRGADSARGVAWAASHDWNRLAVERWQPMLAAWEQEL